MYAAAIGAAMSLASSIFGGIKSSQEAAKAEAQLKAQRDKNEALYKARYYQDPTQTAEAQSMIRKAREEAERQVSAARGIQAVMGTSDASVAAAQENANKLVSDTLSDVAARGTARKDAIEDRYLNNDNSFAQQYMNLYNQRAQNISQAAGQASQAGMGLAQSDMSAHLQYGKGLFESMFSKK